MSAYRVIRASSQCCSGMTSFANIRVSFLVFSLSRSLPSSLPCRCGCYTLDRSRLVGIGIQVANRRLVCDSTWGFVSLLTQGRSPPALHHRAHVRLFVFTCQNENRKAAIGSLFRPDVALFRNDFRFFSLCFFLAVGSTMMSPVSVHHHHMFRWHYVRS